MALIAWILLRSSPLLVNSNHSSFHLENARILLVQPAIIEIQLKPANNVTPHALSVKVHLPLTV